MILQLPTETDVIALQRAIYAWSINTFNYDRPAPAVLLAHFMKETGEIVVDPDDIVEYADALILLLGAIAYSRFTWYEVIEAAWRKHEVNEGRTWGVPRKEDGIIEHIGERSEAAAHRIAACVEACKGIPTRSLKMGIVGTAFALYRDLFEHFEKKDSLTREEELLLSQIETLLVRHESGC